MSGELKEQMNNRRLGAIAMFSDEKITDPLFVFARQITALSVVLKNPVDGTQNWGASLQLAESHLEKIRSSGDLMGIAQTYWLLGICHLALESADDALENFQICAEMTEASGDRITQAWALAYHGLTKRSLYQLLQDDGAAEIESAKKLFAEENYTPGLDVIQELTA